MSSKSSKEKAPIEGQIQINTENIFPIIKKWLYSDHEIFLRELVSNSLDAIHKLQQLAVQNEKTEAPESPLIQITIDKEAKTLTISDTGLGMDAKEVEKYISQIAFSSAETFAKKFKDQDEKNPIIGHFGLGFYSAFMVSDLVEIDTKSYKKTAKAVRWSCDGSTTYHVSDSDRKTVGTDVILHINEESKEFLEDARIQTLVKKYANFLPIEIQVNGEKANDEAPLWMKSPKGIKDEEYLDFYKKIFPFQADPLFWIHLDVDFPFQLKGIIYFPKVMHELDASKGQIHLYCKNVFVSDKASDVIPEFLTLLQGAIDCPEIPLNVSRSSLQNDPYVQKISKHIVKKVADKLNQLAKKDSEKFEEIWNDISPFIKYGMMQNDDFYEKVKAQIIFDSSTAKKTRIEDYLSRNEEKIGKKVLYCADKDTQAPYVALCKEQDLEIIYLKGLIDTHFVQFLESKDSEIKYTSIDSELSEILVDEDKASKVVDEENKSSDDKVAELFKSSLDNESLNVEVKSLKSELVSGMLLEDEYMKRMKQMSQFMPGSTPMTGLDNFRLVLNSNHKLIQDIQRLNEAGGKGDLVNELCHHVYDLAKLSKQQLTGDELQAFVSRSNDLMAQLSQEG